MDFLEETQALGNRVKKTLKLIQTEEATKQAFIIPFIKLLGYDVYDPTEVVPEYTADVGIKKGEKVDYAIIRDGKPAILIECKWCGVDIDKEHAAQLYRYFSVTPARIALLTNGIIFRFFTDLEKPNQMDSKPFLEIDLLSIQEPLISELKKLTKSHFDLEKLIPAATELKYTREINILLSQQFVNPSDDFVKFFASQVYSGRIMQNVLEQFRGITKRALEQFVNDEIGRRLRSVLDKSETQSKQEPPPSPVPEVIPEGRSPKQKDDERIETTPDELEGFKIVRNILKDVVDVERIFYRDAINYFTILLDDNRRKTICRLYFSVRKKYIMLFDQEVGKEEKIKISEVNEINNFAERLKATLLKYEERK